MAKTFMMRLDKLQPSQLFISSAKLSEVMKVFDPDNIASMEPIPIKKLEDDVVFVDGHTRAFAAFLHGLSLVPVYWEEEELDWDAYLVCVGWCKNEGIHTIGDLRNRVVSQEEYELLWYRRCEEMQQDLEAKKRQMQTKEKPKASGKRFCPEY
ncbi:MAG: ParB/Srx family N-terminal domain-containing protein [Candidatus Bathyarchaeota archaeon]|nr:ParB/Srx family N-terminal domain-containing protein [Candidatus Bathyarchaeota archaeon]